MLGGEREIKRAKLVSAGELPSQHHNHLTKDCEHDQDCKDADEWMENGDMHLELGDLRAAITSYVQATLLAPDDSDAWTSRGDVFRDLGMLKDAAKSFKKALTLSPEDHELWSDLGHIFSSLQNRDEAVRCFTKAVDLCPDTVGPNIDRVQMQLYWERAALNTKPPSELNIVKPYRSVTAPENNGFQPTPLYSVHCLHWLDPATCAWLVEQAEKFAGSKGGWCNSRHAQHGTMDIELSRSQVLQEWFLPHLHSTILPTISKLFGLEQDRLRAREVFFVKYSALVGEQSSLPMHRDGHLISFNVLMSEPTTFSGGGTEINSLKQAIHLQQVHQS
jgi:hypothetical protein